MNQLFYGHNQPNRGVVSIIQNRSDRSLGFVPITVTGTTTIDWGDGSTTTLVSGSHTPSHAYSDITTGTRTITIYGATIDDTAPITVLQFGTGNSIVSINVGSITTLTDFTIQNSPLASLTINPDIPNIDLFVVNGCFTTTAQVDAVLIAINNVGNAGTSLQLTGGFGSASPVPSASGLAARTAMLNRGWSFVLVNS